MSPACRPTESRTAPKTCRSVRAEPAPARPSRLDPDHRGRGPAHIDRRRGNDESGLRIARHPALREQSADEGPPALGIET